MDILGKKAVVFGGTSGIGLETALSLHEEGAEVIVVGKNERPLPPSVPDEIVRMSCDVRDYIQVERLFNSIGCQDIIISTATGGERALGAFSSMDIEKYKGSFDKLWGYVNVVQHGLKFLSETGTIVLVSGSPARKCNVGQIALSSVGSAIEAFSKGVAKEIIPKRINVLCPGVIDTPILKLEPKNRKEYYLKRTKNHLIPRAGTSKECSQGIMFLIHNDFVTGTVLELDGGAILGS